MARYILIDNGSGFIWGDSADLEGKIWNGDFTDASGELGHDPSPIGFARALDTHVGTHEPRTYEEVPRHALASNDTGYHVYRADINGSEAVPVVRFGQDRETIEAVVRDCEYVTTIRISTLEGV